MVKMLISPEKLDILVGFYFQPQRLPLVWNLLIFIPLCLPAGGCNKVRGEHWPKLLFALAGVCCLCLWTLPEDGRATPPPREVKKKRDTVDCEHTARHCTPPTPLKHPLLWNMFTLICTEPRWWTPTHFTDSELSSRLWLPLVYLLLMVM